MAVIALSRLSPDISFSSTKSVTFSKSAAPVLCLEWAWACDSLFASSDEFLLHRYLVFFCQIFSLNFGVLITPDKMDD
ncbi:hypothetical protein BpHYR1_005190 [Brachionus plicatilis]|uniref:Uncharacterized protein n=1 Tax=Brachionus plicatilis TaxID=10195 RepID=A0A3M7SU97_BRAPC|nr:hypothetical protein BpHYR1_005190 [Brachionus plicatilis]